MVKKVGRIEGESSDAAILWHRPLASQVSTGQCYTKSVFIQVMETTGRNMRKSTGRVHTKCTDRKKGTYSDKTIGFLQDK